MTDELSAPPVPADLDLRDFGFMPLDIRRLLTSETWIEAADDPRLGHALMSLWCEAWHQVPAGSLPDNDRVLQRLSMCPDQREWKRIRERCLAGWVKCSDGLLYHPVVCEKAREAFQKKLEQRERTRKATEAREAKRRARDEQRNDERHEHRDDERNESRDVHQGTGTGTGTGTVKPKPPEAARTGTNTIPDGAKAAARASSEPPNPTSDSPGTRRGVVAALLRREGVTCTYAHPSVVEWAQSGVTDDQLREALEVARMRKPKPEAIPIAYLVPIVRELRDRPVDAGGSRERDWDRIFGSETA